MSDEVREPTVGAVPGERPFWPTQMALFFAAGLMFIGVTILLASLGPVDEVTEPGYNASERAALEEPADPYETPPKVGPAEWYFNGIFWLRVELMPDWVAVVVLPVLLGAILVAAPFIGRVTKLETQAWHRAALVGATLAFFFWTNYLGAF